MAEAAPAEASAAISPTDIKKEPNPLDGFDFSMISDTASKRPLESAETTIETPEAKRLKSENAPPEDGYDDEMSLLVQNALSNINDIIGQFSEEPDGQAVPTTEPGTADGAPAQEVQPAPIGFLTDPRKFVRDSNINALGSISISMLLILSHQPFDEVAGQMRDPESEQRRTLRKLYKSLQAVRGLYSDNPILLADEFDPHSAGAILQFANLAQLGSWILEGTPELIRAADIHLPAAFRDEIIGLPRRIVDLWVGLRTHRAIHVLQAREDKKFSEEELDGIFMDSVEQKLTDNNIANHIIGSEKPVTDCLRLRMGELRALGPETNLLEQYPADDLLRHFGQYSRNQLSIAKELGERLGFTMPRFEHSVEPMVGDNSMDGMDIDDLSSFFEKTASGLVESALAELDDEQLQPPVIQNGEHATAEPVNGTAKPDEATKANGYITDYKELEALVAESTNNYVKTTLQGLSPTPYQPTVPTSTTESMAAQANYMHNLQHAPQNSYYTSFPQAVQEQEQPPPAPGQNLPPNQTCSSAMLYEKARQAALSRQTAHTRREGLHSTRRPWSQEEEKALMTGLDMVKGPHWSQILSLFGPSGSISDILKDRTQVQLKDKARNLKLFFLKTNSEMPYYLNSVTGELKTRAPTQAARKEAEERARLNSEDEHSKLQGMMALAGSLQHAPQNRAQGGGAGSVGPGVVTPAQAAAQAVAAGQHRTPGHASVSTTPASTTASTPTSQTKPQGQTLGQQSMQSMAQAPSRPQNQLPPQIPRPQPQPQPQRPAQQTGHTTAQYGGQQTAQQHGQYQLPHSPQQPANQQVQAATQPQTSAQASPSSQAAPAHQTQGSSTPTPMTTPAHQSPATGPQSSTQSQYQHEQLQKLSQSPAPGPPATQSPAAPASAPAPATDAPPQPESTAPSGELPELDNETEAALIRDLQAAVAQATSS